MMQQTITDSFERLAEAVREVIERVTRARGIAESGTNRSTVVMMAPFGASVRRRSRSGGSGHCSCRDDFWARARS